jgi:uncharacterized repeat protein (TIGR03803 family)
MRRSSFLQMICIVFVFCVMTAIASLAQTFTTLHSFGRYRANGTSPNALLQGIDGNFYGTTGAGGSGSNCEFGCGTVFKITDAGKLTIVHSFDYTDGQGPLGPLVQGTNENFYGVTTYGGTTQGYGTVFQLTRAGTLTTLYKFCSLAGCTDGEFPNGVVRAANGDLYGTAVDGGANDNSGTVFQLTPAGTLTTLHSFCAETNCTDGDLPSAGLVQAANGDFYGTTWSGGPNGGGAVFSITAAGKLTTLNSFDGTDGSGSVAALVQGTDGNFYGTTESGGTGANCPSSVELGCGTVFKITPAGTLTSLYSFCSQANCTDGDLPFAGLVQGTDGDFYGTTSSGGANCPNNFPTGCGTVFKITATGTLTTLYSFCAQANCADGKYPNAMLMQSTDGNFYGTTPQGGPYLGGTVFRLSVGLGPFVKTNPTFGKVGTKVIILGNNLTGTTNITFNGTTAPLLKVTPSAIETSVPTGATTGTVTVTTASGTLNSNVAFRVLP